MKTVADLLRQGDPLEDDARRLDEARGEIRRTVVAAASVAPPPVTGVQLPRRRIVLGAAGALAASLMIVGLVVGFGDEGTLQAAVRLEVRLAEAEPAPGLIVARVANSDRLVYLHPEPVVTNDDIAQSWVLEDEPDRFGISVHFLEAGAQRIRQATANHVGRPVAILIDGEVVTAPILRSALGDSAVISGNFTRAEAERIADGIAMR